jgi:hypothetical protein
VRQTVIGDQEAVGDDAEYAERHHRFRRRRSDDEKRSDAIEKVTPMHRSPPGTRFNRLRCRKLSFSSKLTKLCDYKPMPLTMGRLVWPMVMRYLGALQSSDNVVADLNVPGQNDHLGWQEAVRLVVGASVS